MTKEDGKSYDLEERTAVFAEEIIDFAKRIPRSPVNTPLISQLVRSGTSIGANYCEADDAFTKKDFLHKISLSRKESKETKFWLRMAVKSEDDLRTDGRRLWREAKELNLIFSSILRKGKDSSNG